MLKEKKVRNSVAYRLLLKEPQEEEKPAKGSEKGRGPIQLRAASYAVRREETSSVRRGD